MINAEDWENSRVQRTKIYGHPLTMFSSFFTYSLTHTKLTHKVGLILSYARSPTFFFFTNTQQAFSNMASAGLVCTVSQQKLGPQRAFSCFQFLS